MAPIKLKEIVTYSSQDENHRAENLLKSQTQWNRWLCAPNDKTGCIQVIIQLEKAEEIDFIDIGNYGSSMVEIQVSRSYDSEFRALLPATMFRTIEESRQGRNKNGVRMFTKDHFIEGVRDQQWDRVKVICRELSKKVNQFGLAFVSFSSVKEKVVQGKDASSVTKSEELEERFWLKAINVYLQSAAVTKGKKKHFKQNATVIPSWKKDASFCRQYLDKTTKKESADPDLKERILKMTSKSEDGPRNEESFGRSAKMLLASSSSVKLREVTNYQPACDTTPINDIKDGLIQFKKKLQNFIRKEGQAIATASLKGLRTKFEDQLGYKMDKTMRLEFKVTLLQAAENVLSQKKSPPRVDSRKRPSDSLETPETKSTKKTKSGPTKRKIFPEKHQAKKLPPSAYRNCPKCSGKFTANQMNLHIANCTPDHRQIAHAALSAIAESSTSAGSIASSPVTSPSLPPTAKARKGKKAVASKETKVTKRKRGHGQKAKPKHEQKQRCSVGMQNKNVPQSSYGGHTKEGSTRSENTVCALPSTNPHWSVAMATHPKIKTTQINCPICWETFDEDLVEIHASTCGVCY